MVYLPSGSGISLPRFWYAILFSSLPPVVLRSLTVGVESHLLQAGEGTTSDIRLSRALRSLDSNLKRYEQVMGAVESGEQTAGDALGYLGFIGRAWAGIIRSRGW